ncbi:hypothetical protein [Aestuariivivens sp. NBU2969]|uniref:hypothetical protein n=1 Tax=Aestuariivivens sp. NBU2969 TaxID=2873267 RepID=UPI001CBC8D91|nr:hypothetical protein [Aestuariivivens sp. NBU2969]
MDETKNIKEEIEKSIKKGIAFFQKLSRKQKDKILTLLRRVQEIQNSNLSGTEKAKEIKKIMWTKQSVKSKLFIGGFLGTIIGIAVFGTGGIGIAGLGGAVGIWGFLAGTAGGVIVSSLIQNFEKDFNNDTKEN